MRKFGMVSLTLWDSKRFTGLATDDARMLFLYVLTSPHSNSGGCYRLPEAYAVADLRWNPERYSHALAELVAAEMLEYDADTCTVRIAKWFKFNPPMNAGHRVGIERDLAKVPGTQLANAALDEMWAIWEADELVRRERAAAKTGNGISPKLMEQQARFRQ